MNVTRKDIDALNVVLTVEIDQEDVAPQVEKVLTDYRKRASIPGFRKGNIPMGVVKKQYGQAVLVDEVNKRLQTSLNDYLNNEKIDILGNPIPVPIDTLDWTADSFSFDFELGLAPEVEVKLPNKRSVIRYDIQADDKFVDEQLERLQKQYGSLTPTTETTSSTELTVGVHFEGVEENKSATITVDELKSKKALTKLKNATIGEVVTLSTKGLFKEEYVLRRVMGTVPEKAIELSLTLQERNARGLAELDQEFFDKVFGKDAVKTVSECKDKLRADAMGHFETQSNQKFVNDMTEHLINNTKFSLPADFLKKWMQTAGENPISAEEAEAEYTKSERGLRYQLIESKLIQEHNLQISREEIESFAKELLQKQMAQFGRADVSDEELTEVAGRILGNQEEVKRISDQVMSEKMRQLFLEKGNIKVKKVNFDTFIK
ncbi:MAG: trigger factor, partial [Flavobacteriaceae bacterium]